MHTFANPYKEFQVDTSLCFSIEYSKSLDYWSRKGVKLTDLIIEERKLAGNVMQQNIELEKKSYLLVTENEALRSRSNILASENYRLNTELGTLGTRMSGVLEENRDLGKKMRWWRATALTVGFMGITGVIIGITQ